jgi:hypothetical protein
MPWVSITQGIFMAHVTDFARIEVTDLAEKRRSPASGIVYETGGHGCHNVRDA